MPSCPNLKVAGPLDRLRAARIAFPLRTLLGQRYPGFDSIPQ